MNTVTTATVTHIRRRPRRSRSTQFYLDRAPCGAENTLCGAPATIRDMSWADARWPKNHAYVNCSACVERRIEQGITTSRKK